MSWAARDSDQGPAFVNIGVPYFVAVEAFDETACRSSAQRCRPLAAEPAARETCAMEPAAEWGGAA